MKTMNDKGTSALVRKNDGGEANSLLGPFLLRC